MEKIGIKKNKKIILLKAYPQDVSLFTLIVSGCFPYIPIQAVLGEFSRIF